MTPCHAFAYSLRPVETFVQGVLNWVGQPAAGQEPFRFEARLYSELFNSLDPSDLGDAWMEDLNPDSETVIKGAYACTQLSTAQPGDRYDTCLHLQGFRLLAHRPPAFKISPADCTAEMLCAMSVSSTQPQQGCMQTYHARGFMHLTSLEGA